MKKLIALALSVLMIFTCFVGCKDKVNEDLANAVAYLENMYQTGSKDEPINLMMDKDVLSVVTIDGVSYTVEWAVTVTEGASDAVKIVESDTENCVKIDIPDMPEADILFTATATVKDKKDNSATAEFAFKVAGLNVATNVDVEAILNEAYALEQGKSMAEPVTLTGKITSVDTPYSAQYKNVTVTIVMEGFDDKPIKCYRLAGTGADTLAVGDTITVTGTIANYQGTIEFEQGCTVSTIVKADGTAVQAPAGSGSGSSGSGSSGSGGSGSGGSGSGGSGSGGSGSGTTSTPSTTTLPTTNKSAATIMNEAYALAETAFLPYKATLKGEVISIDDGPKDAYNKTVITVTMKVEGKTIICYEMSGSKVNEVAVGKTITVTGAIKNHYGKIEFAYHKESGTEVVLNDVTGTAAAQLQVSVVDVPEVGVAYKFGFFSTSKNNTYYATGEMATGNQKYYMATTTTASLAADVYLENTTGGYYLYTMVGGAKKYYNIEATADGQHVNAVFSSTPGMVFVYDTEKKTLVTSTELVKKGESDKFVFGTYDVHTTIGASGASYDNTYYCRFYK